MASDQQGRRKGVAGLSRSQREKGIHDSTAYTDEIASRIRDLLKRAVKQEAPNERELVKKFLKDFSDLESLDSDSTGQDDTPDSTTSDSWSTYEGYGGPLDSMDPRQRKSENQEFSNAGPSDKYTASEIGEKSLAEKYEALQNRNIELEDRVFNLEGDVLYWINEASRLRMDDWKVRADNSEAKNEVARLKTQLDQLHKKMKTLSKDPKILDSPSDPHVNTATSRGKSITQVDDENDGRWGAWDTPTPSTVPTELPKASSQRNNQEISRGIRELSALISLQADFSDYAHSTVSLDLSAITSLSEEKLKIWSRLTEAKFMAAGEMTNGLNRSIRWLSEDLDRTAGHDEFPLSERVKRLRMRVKTAYDVQDCIDLVRSSLSDEA